jgi:hypothetical protein
VIDEIYMRMEHLWNDTDSGNLKYSDKNLPQSNFVHQRIIHRTVWHRTRSLRQDAAQWQPESWHEYHKYRKISSRMSFIFRNLSGLWHPLLLWQQHWNNSRVSPQQFAHSICLIYETACVKTHFKSCFRIYIRGYPWRNILLLQSFIPCTQIL